VAYVPGNVPENAIIEEVRGWKTGLDIPAEGGGGLGPAFNRPGDGPYPVEGVKLSNGTADDWSKDDGEKNAFGEVAMLLLAGEVEADSSCSCCCSRAPASDADAFGLLALATGEEDAEEEMFLKGLADAGGGCCCFLVRSAALCLRC